MQTQKMNSKPTTERKPLDYYLTLNYPITLYPDPDEGGYVAEIKDLAGCLTQGDTLEETIENISEARELWIETVYESGKDIPLPSTEIDDSNQVILQIPKSLYCHLTELANNEKVSLNQYILSVLSEASAKPFTKNLESTTLH